VDNRDIRKFPELSPLQPLVSQVHPSLLGTLSNRDKIASSQLLNEVGKVEGLFPDIGAIYICKAFALAGMDRYEEAYQTIHVGLRQAIEKTYLCEAMGVLMSEQGELDGPGWWMQACILASTSVYPYLYLSKVAYDVWRCGYSDADELRWRLLNAVDIMYPNIFRLDLYTQDRLNTLFKNKDDVEKMRRSLRSFSGLLDAHLPPASLLPKDPREREMFVLAERVLCQEATTRLLSRPEWADL